MLKVAVIGLGDISKIHIPVIQENPNAELVAVCDIDEALKDTVPGVKFYTDYHEMLEQEELDCVHICLPHYLHYCDKSMCRKRNSCISRKTIALNTEEGLALVRLEEEHQDVKICVCFQNRYNETFEKLQEIVESGKYGKVIGLKGLVTWFRPKDYYDVKPWRGNDGVCRRWRSDQSIDSYLDLMQLLGGEIESIRGSIDNLLDYGIEVEDTAVAHIKFKNGATGLFFATNSKCGNSSVELQVVFEKGKFTIKDSILTRVNEEGKKERID